MPTYEKNKVYAAKYLDEQDEIRIRMPKKTGLKEAIKKHAALCGESMNAYILGAIEARMHGQPDKSQEK